MPISAKWKHKSSIHIGFIVFNGGVTTFFAKNVSELFNPFKLTQESHSMLSLISNSSTFVSKRFHLLHGGDKDILSRVLMFVQSHLQTFLLLSTIFYHTACFKCDLCRVIYAIKTLSMDTINWRNVTMA